ncbi:MAG: VOC family protein [Ktedonobacteraceae bacterium]
MSGEASGAKSSQIHIAPWLSVSNALQAVEFYRAAFGAVELYRLEHEGGVLAVAQLAVGEADFWLQQDPESSPVAGSAGPVRMIMSVSDPDSMFAQALAAGASEIAPVSEGFGWRIGRLVDPFGHHWEIGRRLSV